MKKFLDVLLFFSFYIVAYIIGYFLAKDHTSLLLQLFVFDVTATIVMYVFSLIVKNSSTYDAYWSLTPLVMIVYVLFVTKSYDVYHLFFFICFAIWSLRLTINWITTFADRKWEDWRYKEYRKNNGPLVFQIINFFGIQMMPTLIVFLAFIPAVIFMQSSANAYSLIGCGIILIGTSFEFFADKAMHKFLNMDVKKNVCQVGLWNYSRHPNYLGEILVWIGCFVTMIVNNPAYWYLGAGAIVIICLFEFISIPMMEKRQKSRRVEYTQYISSTARLLIRPKKS